MRGFMGFVFLWHTPSGDSSLARFPLSELPLRRLLEAGLFSPELSIAQRPIVEELHGQYPPRRQRQSHLVLRGIYVR